MVGVRTNTSFVLADVFKFLVLGRLAVHPYVQHAMRPARLSLQRKRSIASRETTSQPVPALRRLLQLLEKALNISRPWGWNGNSVSHPWMLLRGWLTVKLYGQKTLQTHLTVLPFHSAHIKPA